MSFIWPWMLVTLISVPLLVGVYLRLLRQRRQAAIEPPEGLAGQLAPRPRADLERRLDLMWLVHQVMPPNRSGEICIQPHQGPRLQPTPDDDTTLTSLMGSL
mgnify:CR=1 FL=1